MEKFNILIVDDIEENIYSLRLLIEDSFECNCYEAMSAMEGLTIIMENKIDMVFLDIQMPEIDGLEFLNYLKSIPVVLVSGIDLSEKNRKDLLAFEDVDFLPKPVDSSKLIAIINNKLLYKK